MDVDLESAPSKPGKVEEATPTGLEESTSAPRISKREKKRRADQMLPAPGTSSGKAVGAAPTFKARFELEKLNQRQLVELVLAHQAHWDPVKAERAEMTRKKFNDSRDIPWEKYSVRHVAFKVVYLGWDFLGLAAQPDTENTIEGCLSKAFMRVKLIKSYDSCHWSRAGRTDKGVSGLGQVIACHVRSNVKSGVGMVSVGSDVKEDSTELDYVTMLNGALPDEIRVIGWTPVPLEFDARFSAITRTYKYFFVRENLNIPAMQEAMSYLLGEHDFRNFCKMDTANVSHFGRCVLSATLAPVAPQPTFKSEVDHDLGSLTSPEANHWSTMYEFTISGSAFLWHQVRYMVAVLFMVGREQEPPSIVKDLLNLEKYPQKPQFHMASEIPLILYDVGYFGLRFQVDGNAQRKLQQHFMEFWSEKSIKAHMARLALTHLDYSNVLISPSDQANGTQSHTEPSQSIEGTASHYPPIASDVSPYLPNHIPKLIPPPQTSGRTPAKRDIKNLVWAPSPDLPSSIPWGFIKDQVMQIYEPKHFHTPLDARPMEESLEERQAKRPYKKPKLGESAVLNGQEEGGDGDE
jgi:tRNA pseudouridine38/39 synthase